MVTNLKDFQISILDLTERKMFLQYLGTQISKPRQEWENGLVGRRETHRLRKRFGQVGESMYTREKLPKNKLPQLKQQKPWTFR